MIQPTQLLARLSAALLLVACSFTIPLRGQAPRAVLEAALRKMVTEDRISFALEARGFSQLTATAGELNFRGAFKKNGNSYYTKAWGRELFAHEQQLFILDHQNEQMLLGRRRAVTMGMGQMPPQLLDSLSDASISYEGARGEGQLYRLANLEGPIHQIDFYLDAEGMLRKMVQYLRESKRVQMRYAKLEVNYRELTRRAPPLSFFSGQRYYRRDAQGHLHCQAPYAHYTIREVDYDVLSNAQF